MAGELPVSRVGQLELGDGHIFASETGFVDEQLPLHDDRIAGSLFARLIEVSRDQVDVADRVEFPVSEYFDRELLLCSFLYFLVAPSKENVVDRSGKPAKEYHQNSEDYHFFEDIEYAYEVLKNEKRLGHCIE